MSTECFYHVGYDQSGRFQFLESMHCDYGCCGTTEDQRCCTEDERYRTEDHGKTWRIVAITLSGMVAILVLCLFLCWVLKKKNKKSVQVSHRTMQQRTAHAQNQRHVQDQADVFVLRDSGEPYPFPKPPPYSPASSDNNPYAGQTGASATSSHFLTREPNQTSFINRGNHSRNEYSNDRRQLPPPPYTSFDVIT